MTPSAETTAEAIPAAAKVVEQDVESPEVFQATDAGLWDGRPSLGGVWVAYPDVAEPERVIIRNTSNGAFVVGALFRRERENPGPRIQVSSDAAAALKMLAGAPAELSVTALRRKEVAVEPPKVEVAPVPAVTEAAPVAEEKPADPVASMAESAIAEATSKAKGGSLPEPSEAPQSATAAAPAATAAPLSAIDTSTIPSPAAKSTLEKPFVQIGIFSVEANAERAADGLRKSGVVPVIRASTLNGKAYWRVLAGPATTSADLSALLNKVKGLGYPDAYAVSG